MTLLQLHIIAGHPRGAGSRAPAPLAGAHAAQTATRLMAMEAAARATRDVYITAAGAYLPGEPVDNDRIENVLGLINGKPSRLKNRILRSNGIKTRHYALDEHGQTTELNEELAVKAVQAALAHSELTLDDVEMLAAGTTQGDVPIPGFASMVHGRLGGRPMEITSTSKGSDGKRYRRRQALDALASGGDQPFAAYCA